MMCLSLTGENEMSTTQQSSRLSKTLEEVLSDKAALGYFVQYLDDKGGLFFVRCWLDIESFRAAAKSGFCTVNTITREQLDDENIDVRLHSPLPSSRLDHDSLSVSTDCDSYTADSNSLHEFSTTTSNFVSTECIKPSSSVDLRPDHSKLSKCEINITSTCDRDVSDTSCRLNKLDLKYKQSNSPVKSSDNMTDCFITTQKFSRDLIDAALRIFKKYIAQEALNPIGCPEDMRNEVINAICAEDKILNTACYDKTQKFVYGVLEQKYFNSYLRSHYNCKYQIDVLTSGSIILQDILYNEAILFYFMEYLEQEGGLSLLEFWLSATNFQRQFNSYSSNPEEAQTDAVILYDKYFSLQAICPLGFGDKIRFLVEENICRENGPECDCFHQPIRLVEYVLDRNYLNQFLSSQLYFKYLSELISTVQTHSCGNSISRSNTTASECSSEISLLLSEDANLTTVPKMRKTLKSPIKSDMNIDTRQLYDPDSLWKRRRTRRLSFGRITDLGRFETDVEPEPDRKSESRLARAMKRLVNLQEETKTKEEMAWQVAEMIVKDVTSVTMGDLANSVQS